MSTQSYPWLKLPHREYLVSSTYAALKPIERLAFLELAMYAHTKANNQLPNDDLALAGWADMSVKQWLKVKASVFSEWLLKDSFWSLPEWFVVDAANTQESNQDDEQSERSSSAERARRYRENKKNRDENNEPSRAVTDSDRDASHERHATVTQENVTHRDEMGGRGEDLDSELKQDLELKQELKSSLSQSAGEKKTNNSQRFFDDELKPNLKTLNDKFIGEITVTQELIDSQLFLFNSHYETQQLTDNQRLAKWVSWIKRKQADEKIAENRSQKITVPSRRTPTPDNFAAKNYSAGINTDGSF